MLGKIILTQTGEETMHAMSDWMRITDRLWGDAKIIPSYQIRFHCICVRFDVLRGVNFNISTQITF